MAAIHANTAILEQDVDGRDKPVHDVAGTHPIYHMVLQDET